MKEHQISLVSLMDGDVYSGAEIGVEKGLTSAVLLYTFPNLTLYMIDRWSSFQKDHPYYKRRDSDALNTDDHHREMLMLARERTFFASTRRKVVISDSIEAAFMVPGNLDFVFIDADHHEVSVAKDLRAWWPKVRPGGLFCGHDYGKKEFSVTKAVDDFARELGMSVTVSPGHVWSWRKRLD